MLFLSARAIVGKLVYPGVGRVLMGQGAGVRRLMMHRRHVVGLWVPRELGLPEPTRVGGLLNDRARMLDDRARVLDKSTVLLPEPTLRLAESTLLLPESALGLAAMVLSALVLAAEHALVLAAEHALGLAAEPALGLAALVLSALVLSALVLPADPTLVLAAATPVLRKHRACRR
jgi:hypothetical protein